MTLLRLGLLLLLTGALLVASAPATLVDAALARASGDGLRLLQAEGSRWDGHGTLASRDPGGRSVAPWLPLAWHFEPAALGHAALAWQFTSSARPVVRIEIGAGGVSLGDLSLHTPADAAIASIPHPIARAGWHGDLSIAAPRWQCPADGLCSGEATLLWRGASSALFPGRRFGDYEAHITAEHGALRYSLATLAGDVLVNGQGTAGPGTLPRFDGTISGEAGFLARLPAIAAGAARPGRRPGEFEIHWPPLK